MSIFSFVTQDELDELDEGLRMAVPGLFNHAQRSLSKQLEKLDANDNREWKTRQDIEQSFMSVIVAIGKRYEIEPFLIDGSSAMRTIGRAPRRVGGKSMSQSVNFGK